MAHQHFRLKVAFSELGQALFMPEENYDWAKNKINSKIFEKLRQAKMEYSVNRTIVFGSAEKHTGLWLNMDFDCVVMVNVKKFPSNLEERELLCKEILPKWENVLSGIKLERKLPGFGLNYRYEGIEIDLLIGFNATHDPSDHGRSERQVANVLQTIKKVLPLEKRIEFARSLSTSLCEKGVGFIKTKSAVTIEVARIAKFWVEFAGSPKVNGKSTLIELICVEAVTRSKNERDILECFKKFLELMIDHSSLRIGQEFLENLDPDEKEYMSKPPYIIDPSNPYNNMYGGPRVDFLKMYKERATETLHKLNRHPGDAFAFKNPRDDDWLDLVSILYVTGSGERHGVKPSDEPTRFKIAVDLDKVDFNICKVFSGDPSQYSDLMRYICCHAAFIPRSVTVFEPYVECLQKALSVNTNIKVEKTVLARDGIGSCPSVNFRYPVKWCNGIWIGI